MGDDDRRRGHADPHGVLPKAGEELVEVTPTPTQAHPAPVEGQAGKQGDVHVRGWDLRRTRRRLEESQPMSLQGPPQLVEGERAARFGSGHHEAAPGKLLDEGEEVDLVGEREVGQDRPPQSGPRPEVVPDSPRHRVEVDGATGPPSPGPPSRLGRARLREPHRSSFGPSLANSSCAEYGTR